MRFSWLVTVFAISLSFSSVTQAARPNPCQLWVVFPAEDLAARAKDEQFVTVKASELRAQFQMWLHKSKQSNDWTKVRSLLTSLQRSEFSQMKREFLKLSYRRIGWNMPSEKPIAPRTNPDDEIKTLFSTARLLQRYGRGLWSQLWLAWFYAFMESVGGWDMTYAKLHQLLWSQALVSGQ